MYYLMMPFIAIFLYMTFAVILKVPTFRTRKAYKKKTKRSGLITDLVDTLAKKLSKKLKLSITQKNKVERLLTSSNSDITAEQFMAQTYVESALPIPFIFVFYFANPIFVVIPIVVSVFLYRRSFDELTKSAEKRKKGIENELLKFVMYMASAMKSNRNMIQCIESYKKNFDTPLTEELTLTLADMRTGNYENALKNMELRNNSSSVSRLVRGLLSSMKGDDMSRYFSDLGFFLTSEWEINLKAQALAQEPKISRLSLIMFAVAIVTVFTVLIVALTSSGSMFGGMM